MMFVEALKYKKNNHSEAIEQSLGLSHPDIYLCARDILKKQNQEQGLFLDVGAGLGEFVRVLKEQTQFSLHGVDLMYSEIKGVEWYVQDLNRNLQFQADKFDVVSCLEVVEHIENPRKLIREIFRVLKPGGCALISTPNNESWRAIISYIFRGHFVAFTDSSYPAHITAINQKDIHRMFSESGFMDIQFFYSNKGVVPKWTTLNWQDINSHFFKGQRFSDNILCFAHKPGLRLASS